MIVNIAIAACTLRLNWYDDSGHIFCSVYAYSQATKDVFIYQFMQQKHAIYVILEEHDFQARYDFRKLDCPSLHLTHEFITGVWDILSTRQCIRGCRNLNQLHGIHFPSTIMNSFKKSKLGTVAKTFVDALAMFQNTFWCIPSIIKILPYHLHILLPLYLYKDINVDNWRKCR